MSAESGRASSLSLDAVLISRKHVRVFSRHNCRVGPISKGCIDVHKGIKKNSQDPSSVIPIPIPFICARHSMWAHLSATDPWIERGRSNQ